VQVLALCGSVDSLLLVHDSVLLSLENMLEKQKVCAATACACVCACFCNVCMIVSTSGALGLAMKVDASEKLKNMYADLSGKLSRLEALRTEEREELTQSLKVRVCCSVLHISCLCAVVSCGLTYSGS
jgi:hypothetical protein